MAEHILITQSWYGSRFHCPACGAVVCSDKDLTDKPCKHLLFSWINEVGEYHNLKPSLQPHIDALIDSDECFLPEDQEFLEGCPETAVLFAFEAREMACGPITTQIVHAIDFGAE